MLDAHTRLDTLAQTDTAMRRRTGAQDPEADGANDTRAPLDAYEASKTLGRAWLPLFQELRRDAAIILLCFLACAISSTVYVLRTAPTSDRKDLITFLGPMCLLLVLISLLSALVRDNKNVILTIQLLTGLSATVFGYNFVYLMANAIAVIESS